MSIEIKVPSLPESVSDATVAKWHRTTGEFIAEGDTILDLETDKVMLEVPAPCDGSLSKIDKQEGDVVVGNDVLGSFTAGKAPATDKTAESKADKPKEAVSDSNESKQQSGPAVRREAKANNIDLSTVSGSGKAGRILKQDIASGGSRHEERIPMTRIRARIAQRLLEVTQTTAMLTTFNEVNMKSLMDERSKHKEAFEAKNGVKLGMMSFFTKAVVAALKAFPDVNASIDGNDIIYHRYCDVGIAVDAPRGLVVPIIRNAEHLNFAQIEEQIKGYAIKARNNKLTMDDMTGGNFTISNAGKFGSMLSTPILNAPQSAILGMHNIIKRPIVENDQIIIAPVMYLALSYDHRIVDGGTAVQFLMMIKESIEDPARLLLEI